MVEGFVYKDSVVFKLWVYFIFGYIDNCLWRVLVEFELEMLLKKLVVFMLIMCGEYSVMCIKDL